MARLGKKFVPASWCEEGREAPQRQLRGVEMLKVGPPALTAQQQVDRLKVAHNAQVALDDHLAQLEGGKDAAFWQSLRDSLAVADRQRLDQYHKEAFEPPPGYPIPEFVLNPLRPPAPASALPRLPTLHVPGGPIPAPPPPSPPSPKAKPTVPTRAARKEMSQGDSVLARALADWEGAQAASHAVDDRGKKPSKVAAKAQRKAENEANKGKTTFGPDPTAKRMALEVLAELNRACDDGCPEPLASPVDIAPSDEESEACSPKYTEADLRAATARLRYGDREIPVCVTNPLCDTYGVYYDGGKVHRVPFGPVVEEGTVMHDIVENGPGYMIVKSGKGKVHMIADACLREASVPGYRWRGAEYPPVKGVIFAPHLNNVRNNVPMDYVTGPSMAAITRISNSNYSHEPQLADFISFTNVYYYNYCCYQLSVSDEPRVRRMNGLVTTDECRQFLPQDVEEMLTREWDGKMYTVPHEECSLGFSWASTLVPRGDDLERHSLLRSDMSFGGLVGCHISENEDSDAWGLPEFDGARSSKDGYRTAFFQVHGDGQPPFVQYGRTRGNLLSGLKRVMARRPIAEKWYRSMSRRLARRVADFSETSRFFHPIQGRMLANRSKRFMQKFYSSPSVWMDDADVRAYADGAYNLDVVGTPDENELKCPLPNYLDDDVEDRMMAFTSNAMQKLVYATGRTLVQKVVDCGLNASHWLYYRGFELLLTLGASMWSREFAARMPHVKRELRKAYVMGIKRHDDRDALVYRLNGAVKAELAKYGKAPRLFVNYDAGCMYASELPEFVKVCLNGEHALSHRGAFARIHIFAKPKSEVLVQAFRDLICAAGLDNYMYALIFSDDVVYAGRMKNRLGVMKSFCFNGDIASNDSSQDAAAFLSTFLLLSRFHEKRAEVLVEQCMKPMVFRNPDNPEQSFTVKCDVPFEGSGTTLTTILNHVASFLISCNFFWLLAEGWGSVEDCYVAGAAYVGHNVTMDTCMVGEQVVAEKIQFLKRSPILGTRDGVVDYYPVKNYGCILRSLGTLDGDLQPSQLGLSQREFWHLPAQVKMELFVGGVVGGDCNEPQSRLMNAFRERFPSGKSMGPTSASDIVTEPHDFSDVVLIEDSLLRRYGATQTQLDQLCNVVRHMRTGMSIVDQFAARAYAVDYGVKAADGVVVYLPEGARVSAF